MCLLISVKVAIGAGAWYIAIADISQDHEFYKTS